MVLPTIGERAKGVFQELEQLNIVGKRSGDGFVSHRSTMMNVLQRGLADRLHVMDFTIGRKGLLNYIRSLAGSNFVKIVPSANGNGSDSDDEHTADKRLKVVCGAFTTYLDDEAWINDNTGLSYAEIRICRANTITPNVGSIELAEALSRVLPFTAKKEDRPILRCVLFEVENGTLKLVSADGFRLATVALDYEHDGEALNVLIDRDLLKGIPSVLRKAKRVRVSFGDTGDSLNTAMYIDTEIARYRFVGSEGSFPNYNAIIPAEFTHHAQIDSSELLKAILNIKASAADVSKGYSIDMTLGDGQLVLAHPDNHAQAVVKADTGDGVVDVRLEGSFVVDVMKAIGSGMTDFALSHAHEPVMFSADNFQAIIMPVLSPKAVASQQADTEGKPEATEPEATEPEATEPEATAEVETEATAEATAEGITDDERLAEMENLSEKLQNGEITPEETVEQYHEIQEKPVRGRTRGALKKQAVRS